jgi:hypothetical protein
MAEEAKQEQVIDPNINRRISPNINRSISPNINRSISRSNSNPFNLGPAAKAKADAFVLKSQVNPQINPQINLQLNTQANP